MQVRVRAGRGRERSGVCMCECMCVSSISAGCLHPRGSAMRRGALASDEPSQVESDVVGELRGSASAKPLLRCRSSICPPLVLAEGHSHRSGGQSEPKYSIHYTWKVLVCSGPGSIVSILTRGVESPGRVEAFCNFRGFQSVWA